MKISLTIQNTNKKKKRKKKTNLFFAFFDVQYYSYAYNCNNDYNN
jgi:hypothetical protein